MKNKRDLLPFQEAICCVVEESDHGTDIYIQNEDCYGEGVHRVLLDDRVRDERKVSQNKILLFFCIREKAFC